MNSPKTSILKGCSLTLCGLKNFQRLHARWNQVMTVYDNYQHQKQAKKGQITNQCKAISEGLVTTQKPPQTNRCLVKSLSDPF